MLVVDWQPCWDLYPSCSPFAFDAVATAVVVLSNEAAGEVGGVLLHSEAVLLAVVFAAASAVADIAVLAVEPMVVLRLDVAEGPQPPSLLPVELVVAGAAVASSSFQCSWPAAADVASVWIYHCRHRMKQPSDRAIPPIVWPFGGACSTIPGVH